MTTTTMTSFFNATTNLGRMHSWKRGVGDFYDDDENEDGDDDNDHNNDGDGDDDYDHNNDDNDEDDLNFYSNNQPWLDAFQAEGGRRLTMTMTNNDDD